ncbi:Signal transduction histidine kinase [Paenibacillus sp. 1_12]|uniref:ATP-binding protein n=1 Tax=Paenibacillus sp. 1_12 TaxID=1566278 RepID=UPI0008F05DC2|nr:ATP-binding protein [Paenibacillus sp. 1_12]SFL08257.1 Signal transduction histidine kinase [Paenibacillus sp. 1_12]
MISYFFLVSIIVKEPFRPDLSRSEQIKAALSASLLGILMMYFSFEVTNNIRLDLRNIPIIIIAAFSGPIPALLAGGLIAAARYLFFGFNESSLIAALSIVILTLGAAAATWAGRIWRVWSLATVWSLICTVGLLVVGLWGTDKFWSIAISYSLISIFGGAGVTYLVMLLQNSAVLARQNQKYLQQSLLQNEELEAQNEEIAAQQEELETMLHKIESQYGMIERILQASSDGVILCDASGHIRYSNEQMKRLGLGCANWDNIMDWLHSWQRLVQPSDLKLREHAEEVLAGRENSYRVRFSMPLEKVRYYIEMRVEPISTDQAQGEFLLLFRDRTEEEKADEIKNEFISVVSHELRTPLSSVQGFLEILLHRDLSEEKQKRYLQTVYDESLRLSHLINDFLDIQRLEAGREEYHFELMELCSFTEQMIEEWKQSKQKHRLFLQVADEELSVLADRDKLKQVYLNLLSNAVKYSPEAERIDVRIFRCGSDVQVEFVDYGLGIPDDAKSSVFQQFYRVDNSDRRKIGGSGLGLTIVKKIVEAHGGAVSFESVFGEGTTFSVKLPISNRIAAEQA